MDSIKYESKNKLALRAMRNAPKTPKYKPILE